MHEAFARELCQLAAHDLAVREQLLNEGKLSDGYNPDMEAVHRANAARLRAIIASIGWPTRSKVGAEASEAAWLIVQHAIGEPSFMKDCYVLMQNAQDDIDPQYVAYLYDRICYFEGRPQRYGTQYDGRQLYPVENRDVVNSLRAALKLPPIPDERIVEVSRKSTPGDLHTDPAFDDWRRKVGWI